MSSNYTQAPPSYDTAPPLPSKAVKSNQKGYQAIPQDDIESGYAAAGPGPNIHANDEEDVAGGVSVPLTRRESVSDRD